MYILNLEFSSKYKFSKFFFFIIFFWKVLAFLSWQFYRKIRDKICAGRFIFEIVAQL